MKKKNNLLKLSGLVLACGLLLAGCGGSNKQDGTNAATAGQTAGTADDGAVLTVAQIADAVSLDPHKANDSASVQPMRQIYNELVTLDQDMKVIPSLATEWEQVDDLTWLFHLREGVLFHNGDELKASDVVFSFNRLINPETAAPAAFMLSVIDVVSAEDDYTVKIITKTPFAPLLYNLTHNACAIISEKAVTAGGDGYGQNPVGTGPFKFQEWKKNQEISFEANPDYFMGAAQLSKLVFRIIPESSTAISELKTGGVDMVLDLPAQYADQLNGGGLHVEKFSTFTTKYLGFDHRQEPFNDVRVRQAINHATNKDAIIKVAFNGNGQVLSQPMAPGINGYNTSVTPYAYDVEKAKSLLAEAGFADGFTSKLYISDKEEDNKIATLLQSQLKEVGISVEIQVIEWGAYLSKTSEGVPMFLLGWSTVTGDSDNGMYSNFHSSAFGSQGNRIFYSSPEVDKLMDDGREEFDPAARARHYEDAAKIINDDAAWDFLLAKEYLIGMNDNVQNFQSSPTTLFEFYSISKN